MAAPLGPPLRFETADFIIRSLVLGDESEEWGGWLTDPRLAAMINARPGVRSLADLRRYIGTFDRIDRHLFGIFEKTTGQHIGIRTVEFRRSDRSFDQHILVAIEGRRQGAMYQSGQALVDWAYETCDMLYANSSVIATNRKMLRHIQEDGWVTTGRGFSPSAVTGQFIDIVLSRRSRDTWRTTARSSHFRGDKPQTGLEHQTAPEGDT